MGETHYPYAKPDEDSSMWPRISGVNGDNYSTITADEFNITSAASLSGHLYQSEADVTSTTVSGATTPRIEVRVTPAAKSRAIISSISGAVITSGGNDMKAALPQVILGTDGPVKAEVAANIDAALGELLAPGRFGPGVEVFVFEGNIYDASDGMGNFSEGKCAFGNGLPPIPTDAFFDAWNGVIADAVEARGEAAIDMHGYFYDHGYNNPPNWYASDCTHPSMLGHDQLRRLFYEAITGEALP